MKIDIKNLPDSPEELQKIIFEMHEAVHKKELDLLFYKQRYIFLLEELRLARQQRFAPSSEKNVLQMDLFDEPGVELPDEVKEQLHDAIEVKGHARKKHPVRRPLPKDLPREVVLHDISAAEKICGCGAHLARIGEEITEQLKYVPAALSVVQHVRPKYACRPCEGNVKILPMPILFLPKCIATPELAAHTIVSKYCDSLPLHRQENIWRRVEIDLPRSSLCGWTLKAAELCSPLIKLLQKNIISDDYAQADETPVQVLGEVGRSNTTKSFMWCYRGGGKDRPTIVYEYQETRGGNHAQQFLAGFKGYLQTDAYSGYNWADKNPDIISVGCNAHARRPFAELVKLSKSSGLAYDAIKFYKKIYAIEDEARKNNLSFDARHELRHKKSVPVLDAFKKWLDHHLPKVSEQGKIGKAIRYCLLHWTELTNFLCDGRIEVDNNLIENAIRPFAIGRKNWLFAGSPRGAQAGATLYSLIETCKVNNVEPYKYFCAVFHRIRHCKTDEDYRKLLPYFIEF